MTVRTRNRNAERQAEWKARETRRRRLMLAGWSAAGLLFVAMLAYLVWQEARPIPQPGVDVPILSAEHVSPGVPHEPYNSDPPTSGQHYEQTADVGFYDEAPADELLVHNLEHGNVIIWYNCSQLDDAACTELKGQIRDVMSRAGVSRTTRTLELLAVPRPSLDAQIALTAWGRLDKLDAFDRQRILDFINAFRDGPKAPEPLAP